MATLRIKNFPEPLYERLMKLARANGRPLAEEVVFLLGEAVGERERCSLLDLKGLGKEAWEGIDAGHYVDRERRSWD